MKKNKLLLTTLVAVSAIALGACGTPVDPESAPTVFCPVGSTLLGISDYANTYQDKVTVGNATLIAPAMLNKQYDIVVAPITAGINVYSKAQNYVLDNVFVWGNFYLLSEMEIDSVDDLNGKTITAFQKGNVPEIVLETVLRSNEIECPSPTYLSNVEATAAAFLQGTADIILSAEPSVQQILSKKPNTHVLDLQKLYKEATNNAELPQAGIFVSKDFIDNTPNYNDYLNLIRNSVRKANQDPTATATNAMKLTDNFTNLGAEKLAAAIPGCNFALKSKEQNKNAINTFLTNSNEIVGTTYTLPDEAFYL